MRLNTNFVFEKNTFKWNFFERGIFHHDTWTIFKSAQNSWSFYAPYDLLQGQNFHLSDGQFFTFMTQIPIFGKKGSKYRKKAFPNVFFEIFCQVKKVRTVARFTHSIRITVP